ncbi:hypothetical protein HQ585_12540 [candidate division KSB1 bacterium]|nr:hypothetical protein [candidate division KSB1 bacterium]
MNSRFYEGEKLSKVYYKIHSNQLPDSLREDGIYKNKPRTFCLPRDYSEYNLFSGIREESIQYFKDKSIKWHDNINSKPSNHLLDSQVCCVNFLFPFIDKPESLKSLLRPIYPNIEKIIPMEDKEKYISFEWIGLKNYLKEKIRIKNRTRGAYFTSSDAALMFEQDDGKKHILLIEWKYTESYSSTNIRYSKNNTDRMQIYSHILKRNDCPLNKGVLPDLEALFYEPFYQFMRLQLLAHEMERENELGADIVTVLHIAPKNNLEFQRITSPKLEHIDNKATLVWQKVLNSIGKFRSISTESMFHDCINNPDPDLVEWASYINEKYNFIRRK